MTNAPRPPDTSLTRGWLNAARYYLGGRRGPLILAAAIVAGGLALNWSWLAAVGVAPLLIGVLPCVAMCALGLCMHKKDGQPCSIGRPSERRIDPRGDMGGSGTESGPRSGG